MTWIALPSNARVLFYAQALTRLAFFWLPVTAVATAFLAGFWALVPALAVGGGWLMLRVVLALWMPSLSYDRWAYALRDDDLLIAHGVLFRTVTAIPSARIQHVDTRQGPLERWLGLMRIHIYTASGMGADGTIPGLTVEEAEELRDRLVRVAGDDGV